MRSMRLREADRIVHMYTERTHGKVGAVVKGVRRTKSRFGARLEPFFRVSLVIYEGRGDLHTVTQAQCVESYPAAARARWRDLRRRRPRASPCCGCSARARVTRPAYNLLCHELQLLDSQPPRPRAAGTCWRSG